MSTNPEEVIALLDRADEVVRELCNGTQRWVMCVPARPDHDPDLVIGSALHAARTFVIANAEVAERVVPFGSLATALNLLATFRDHIGMPELLEHDGEEIDAFLGSLSTS